MYLFKFDNNSVSWVLWVKGGIDWWLDFDEEFVVVVVFWLGWRVLMVGEEEVLIL